MSKLNN